MCLWGSISLSKSSIVIGPRYQCHWPWDTGSGHKSINYSVCTWTSDDPLFQETIRRHQDIVEINVDIVHRRIYTLVGVTESSVMPLYGRTITETDMSSRWLPWLSLGALKLAFSASGDGWGDHPGDISVSLIKSPCIQCLGTVVGAIILATYTVQWLYRYCIRIYCIQCFRDITLIVDLCAYLFLSLSL